MRKNKIVNFELVETTPAQAAEMLGANYEKNRKIRRLHVNQLANDMRNGLYDSENGQTIVRGVDGKLYDGQHRLTAQVESGVTLRWLIVTVADGEKAFYSLDNATRRTPQDFFYDMKNKSIVASVAKLAYSINESSVPLLSAMQGKVDSNATASRIAVTTYAQQHVEEIGKAAEFASRMRSALNRGFPSTYAAFAYLVDYVGDGEYLDEFLQDCQSLAPDCKTITAMKTVISNSYANSKQPTQKWLLGILLDAYYHFSIMDDSTMLNKGASRIKSLDEKIQGIRAKSNGDENAA